MAKITIDDILSEAGLLPAINLRFQQVEDEFNNKALYRDNPGTEPNEMNQDLDMNGQNILNLPVPSEETHPVRLKELEDLQAALGTDHSVLNNLDADDHPQYHTDERGDSRYYTQAQIDARDVNSLADVNAPSPSDGEAIVWDNVLGS